MNGKEYEVKFIKLCEDVAVIKTEIEEVKADVKELKDREHCNLGRIAKLEGMIKILKGDKIPRSIKIGYFLSIAALLAAILRFLL